MIKNRAREKGAQVKKETTDSGAGSGLFSLFSDFFKFLDEKGPSRWLIG
jgi:hypothetical protein